jgi:hypothetical protein
MVWAIGLQRQSLSAAEKEIRRARSAIRETAVVRLQIDNLLALFERNSFGREFTRRFGVFINSWSQPTATERE